MNSILNKLINSQNMTAEETKNFLSQAMQGKISSVEMGAILTALRIKGETTDEIFGLIKGMRQKMIKVKAIGAIDVCGTGGDESGSFNISTAVAFVTSGAGVKVVKHGNRAVSSKSGSADVLEKLGVNLKLKPRHAERVFNKVGMVFLFAPFFHPAMKKVAEVRRQLKIRTIFNFIGPFTNPAAVKRQLIGVPTREIAKKLARVSTRLNYDHLMIVSSFDGLDEISLSEPTHLFEIRNTKISESILYPKDHGFKSVSTEEFKAKNTLESAQIIKNILNGKVGPHKDIAVLNTGMAIYISGLSESISHGIELANLSIETGRAKKVLEKLIIFSKKYEKHS